MNERITLVACGLRAALLGLLLLPASASNAASDVAPLALEDFAVGRALLADEPGGLQSLLLDFGVYRHSVENGLADLRVFDADGRPAPYAIRRRLPRQQDEQRVEGLPIFRLDAKSTNRGEISVEDYRIDAEISASGAIVRVHRDSDAPGESGAPSGWLLDATDIDRAIVGIELDFEPGDRDFVDRLRIDTSSDLARWRRVDAEIAVARLSQAGHRIERSRFDLPSTSAKYLRLTPAGDARLPELRSVRVRLATRVESLVRFRQTIAGRADPESPGVVVFDLGAEPPIERVRVVLAEPGTVVEARLESATSPDGPWRVRRSDVFYYYERQGHVLRNSALAWDGSRDPFVRIVTSARGGGLAGDPPQLEIEWIPEQLVYLDRGSGASTLAIGHAGAKDASFEPAQLLRTHRARASDLREPTARLGPEKVLAGDAALDRSVPIPWRTYGLWGLLVAVVCVVLGLSLRLIREADARPDA